MPTRLLDRLLGQETEYAIRAKAAPDTRRKPGNLRIYRSLLVSMGELTRFRRGRKVSGVEPVFLENGGSFCYEAIPADLSAGLVEGATPECRGPAELLVYQRAQERLLARSAVKVVEDNAGLFDSLSELGLIKNCRDHRGNIYGAQENYEVDVATGYQLWLYRGLLVAVTPLALVSTLLLWLFMLRVFALMLLAVPLGLLLYLAVPRWRPRLTRLFDQDNEKLESILARLLYPSERLAVVPFVTPCALVLRLMAFRALRGPILAFLVSRPILSGTGTVSERGFGLSEKGPAMRRIMRLLAGARSRSIFDTGNLLKGFMAPASLQLRPYLDLFRRRQRLQLGLADSNRAQVAEYLKIATTSLVLDMAEAGHLADAPRLANPIPALHAVVDDPTLTVQVALRDGRHLSALELQRWYLERAERFVAESAVPSLEARDVVRLWRRSLDALERDPEALLGRIDWITKKWLVESAGKGARMAVRKKIDIGYHELETGYFAQLEDAGLAPRLVSDEEVERAITEPPASGPAHRRGHLIRELASSEDDVVVGWKSIRVGGRIRGKVIHLDDHRD